MKLNRNQVSKLQQASWALVETLNLLRDAGFDYQHPTYKKLSAARDEVYEELDTYEMKDA